MLTSLLLIIIIIWGNMKKLLLLFVSIMAILFNACSTTTVVSNSIPAEMQQNIRTTKISDMDYSFTKNHNGDAVSISLGAFTSSFSVNAPLYGMMNELIETKFGNISSTSVNKIEITLVDVKILDDYANTLDLTVNVSIKKDGVYNRKSFSYSNQIKMLQINKYSYQADPKDIQNLLLKFVVSVDKYIDTIFDIK